ncbi:MAG: hypothetical protein H6R18_1911 [Proteobacteria bacterium]|nr:hypothetical protein [Pseudomonadota bacterium]
MDTEISVRLDQLTFERLETTIGAMQVADENLTVDDCIAAIFSIGLINVFGAYMLANLIETT